MILIDIIVFCFIFNEIDGPLSSLSAKNGEIDDLLIYL